MAIAFDDVAGEAKKIKVDYYKFTDGENAFRMVGDVLPRYVYWKKTPDGQKTMNVECLSFNRDKEKFDNAEKDWFNHYFSDDKCSWSYLVKSFDEDGKLVVVALKKKLFQSILNMAKKHLGDPTNPDKGWVVNVERVKTGPLVYNVAYELDQLGCKKMPLTDEQKEEVANSPTIDAMFPRQTPEEQKAFIEKVWFSTEPEEEADEEVVDEFDDTDDDI